MQNIQEPIYNIFVYAYYSSPTRVRLLFPNNPNFWEIGRVQKLYSIEPVAIWISWLLRQQNTKELLITDLTYFDILDMGILR